MQPTRSLAWRPPTALVGRRARFRYVTALVALTGLAACSRHPEPAAPFQVTDYRRATAIQAVRKHESTLAKLADRAIFVNTSRGSATQQTPFYCPDELIVSADVLEYPDGSYVSVETAAAATLPPDYDAVTFKWRVDLSKKMVQGPSVDSLNQLVSRLRAGASPTPESVPRCLDGSNPILLNPHVLPDANADEN